MHPLARVARAHRDRDDRAALAAQGLRRRGDAVAGDRHAADQQEHVAGLQPGVGGGRAGLHAGHRDRAVDALAASTDRRRCSDPRARR